MKKLSIAQKKVVEFLNEDKSFYIHKSNYFNHQKIVSPIAKPSKHDPEFVTNHVHYFSLATLNCLIKNKIIQEFEINKFRLWQS